MDVIYTYAIDDEAEWTTAEAIATVEGLSVHMLARMADVRGAENEGHKFLDLVRDGFAEWLGYCGADCPEDVERMQDEERYQRAEAVVPVYNSDLWATFSALGAWSEDVTDLVAPEADMDTRGRVALSLVAERLWDALVALVVGGIEDVAA